MRGSLIIGELSGREGEGRDYRIKTYLRDKDVLVVAPHGGQIEPAAAEIAEAIAGGDYSFCSFEGVKPSGNRVLQIESHPFDEPRAIEAVKRAEIVVTVHGHADREMHS